MDWSDPARMGHSTERWSAERDMTDIGLWLATPGLRYLFSRPLDQVQWLDLLPQGETPAA